MKTCKKLHLVSFLVGMKTCRHSAHCGTWSPTPGLQWQATFERLVVHGLFWLVNVFLTCSLQHCNMASVNIWGEIFSWFSRCKQGLCIQESQRLQCWYNTSLYGLTCYCVEWFCNVTVHKSMAIVYSATGVCVLLMNCVANCGRGGGGCHSDGYQCRAKYQTLKGLRMWVCWGVGGLGDGDATVTASCVDVSVVFNVKCTLFFGRKWHNKLSICKMKRINDNQHALTNWDIVKQCVNVVYIFPRC